MIEKKKEGVFRSRAHIFLREEKVKIVKSKIVNPKGWRFRR